MLEKYYVKKVKNVPKRIEVEVPGSKSITNRALLIAAMANGTSVIKGVLFSDDSRHFLQCLIDLGFSVEIDETNKIVTIEGKNGEIPKKEAEIYVGSAGTAARFLTAMLGLSDGTYTIRASAQMEKRPMDSLFASLKELGADITYLGEEGHLPVKIGNSKIKTACVTVDIEKSSQFLSALLISSNLLKRDFTIEIAGNHGMAYIDMTIHMMEQFGYQVEKRGERQYFIPANQQYKALEYQVEPDVSAACYFYGMAAILGCEALVQHVHKDSMQGDIQFLDALTAMGCTAKELPEGMLLQGANTYKGIEINMGSFSDQTMTMAVTAIFAESATTITGIEHIRYQESNRIQAVLNELTRMGIACEEVEGGIKIYPGTPNSAEIETYDDHRMAMAFSLAGLRAEGIVIKDPMCCRKTFETYFDVLDKIFPE